MKKNTVSLQDRQFGLLFRKFRLRSEIETVAECANALAEEGIAYETSILTRWQRGERVPRKRKTILKLIEIFAKRGGIRNDEEIRAFLSSVCQRDLDKKERASIHFYLRKQMKQNIAYHYYNLFTGREQIRKDMSWDAVRQRNILLYGFPGTGKTILVWQLLYDMRHSVHEGVFWFDCAVKGMDTVGDEILRAYHIDPSKYSSFREKMDRLYRLFRHKSIILVFDNVEERHMSLRYMQEMMGGPVSVILISRQHIEMSDIEKTYHVSAFTPDEYLAYGEKILGDRYVRYYHDLLEELGERIGKLPVLSTHCFRYLKKYPDKVKRLCTSRIYDDMELSLVEYGKQNLHASLTYVFSWLSEDEQRFLHRLQAFPSPFFSADAVMYEDEEASDIIDRLRKNGLIEHADRDRYRIHPVMKMYLKKQNYARYQDNMPYPELFQFLSVQKT